MWLFWWRNISWAITELVAPIPACFRQGNFFFFFSLIPSCTTHSSPRCKQSKRERVTYLANDSNSLKMIKSSLSITSLLLCLTLRHIIFAENKTQVMKERKTEPVNNKKQTSQADKLNWSVRKSWVPASFVYYHGAQYSLQYRHSHAPTIKHKRGQIAHRLTEQATRYTCPKMLLNFFSPHLSFIPSHTDVPVP